MEKFYRILRFIVFFYKKKIGDVKLINYCILFLLVPILQMICFSFVSSYANKGNVVQWIIGNCIIISYMSSLFGIGSQLYEERNRGSLPIIILSPLPKVELLIATFIIHFLESVLSIILGFLVAILLFKFSISQQQLFDLLYVFMIASFSSIGFGIMISSIGILTRDINLILNLFYMCFLGLTGANFPIEHLPHFLRYFSKILPLSRSIKIAKSILNGSTIYSNKILAVEELFISIFYIILGLILFKFLNKIAYKKGTLDIF